MRLPTLIATTVALLQVSALAFAQEAARPAEPKPAAVWGAGANELKIATGSPGELGLLEALATKFAAASDAKVVWFKAGSGQAMQLLKDRKVDMALAHAPAAEKQAVKDGWATGRRVIGGNEFWIVGPAGDPAKIGEAKDAADAFKRIHATAGAKFVTRGDNSGTHQKELQIWKAAGLEPPAGERYIATKDFMSASLKRAETEQGYFLTDSSTFIVERAKLPGLKRLFRGGDMLLNPYHTLWLSEPTPGTATARRFAEFLYSAETQAMMAAFGKDKYGEAMYSDAAATAKLIGE